MRVPYKWLKEFVPGLPADADAIAARLTAAGLEVEGVQAVAEGFDKVVVGRLLEVAKHPNADKLTVTKVALTPAGPEGEVRQIVCGAQNHKAGDKVAVALPGAKLPNGLEIKKGKIRGEASDGMLCSEVELRLATESAGIWILPPETREGTPVLEAMDLADWIFEVGLTPNRGDCNSILGIAREVAAAFGLPLETPKPAPKEASEPASGRIKVRLEDPQGCPRYIARVIEDVKIGPSPAWMARRLEQCGVRPINNVVDVTNYVMLKLGQPLHAFDARFVRGNEIVVRRAKQGESMTTLDGVERRLSPEDLVIADGQGPVALAGVMGGEHSGVLEETRTVVLESAWFDPSRVRKTGRAHGLHTESSHRFERSVDPTGVDRASRLAAQLIAELAGGKILAGSVEALDAGFDLAPRKIPLSRARVRAVVGIDPSTQEIIELLRPLGLLAEEAPGSPDVLEVTVPRVRADLGGEIDLVEEVARRAGYDRIPERAPRSNLTAEGRDLELDRVRAAREVLVGAGFSEALNLPFGARDEAARLRLGPDDPRAQTVPLANPLAEDQAVMRGSLLPGLLSSLARNQAHRIRDVRLFELRPTFRFRGSDRLPDESRRIAALMAGARNAPHWDAKPVPVDFFDAKGLVEALVERFTTKAATFTPSEEPFLVPGAQARVDCAGRTLGTFGEVHPDVLAAFGADAGNRSYAFELDFDALAGLGGGLAVLQELPRFPAVDRDVALLVAESVRVGDLLAEARRAAKKGLEKVDVFDVFRGGKLPEGTKSVALGMTWRATDRTLTDDEVNALHEKLVAGLVDRFKAERR